ncbi:hypothetical protein D3C75_872930 [compost metagenome]
MGQGLAGLAREHHLYRHVVVIEQPAQHIQLMDQGVGDRHVGLVVLAHGRVAVGAMQHQRLADLATVDH